MYNSEKNGNILRCTFMSIFKIEGEVDKEKLKIDIDRWNKCAELFLKNESDFKDIRVVIIQRYVSEHIYDEFCRLNDVKVTWLFYEYLDQTVYRIKSDYLSNTYDTFSNIKLDCIISTVHGFVRTGNIIWLDDRIYLKDYKKEYNNNTKPKYYLAKKLYICFQESFFNTKQLEALCKFELESEERKLYYSTIALLFFSTILKYIH